MLRPVLILYNLLLPVFLILGFPSFIIKGIKRGGLKRNFRQRFAAYQPEVLEKLGREGTFWIHAVSVGEILVAEKIISALHEREPTRNVVLSTTTTTGYRIGDEKYVASDRVTVIHNPVDLPFVTARAIRLIQPEKLILVEAEVWPNLVRQLQKRGVPVHLVNARLSPRSEKRYLQFGGLIRPVFGMVSHVCVPFETDFDRWSGLGVDRKNITLTRSVKFDEDQAAERPEAKIAELKLWLQENGVEAGKQPILLGGSTHAGEEVLLGKVWRNLQKTIPDLALVIVPRHAERAGEIQAGLEATGEGIGSILRVGKNVTSALADAGTGPMDSSTEADATSEGEGENDATRSNRVGSSNRPCLIANTTGELRAWFYLADVVVIGKSITGKGGQNPVEPVMAGCPTIVGPNMQNFTGVMGDLVAADGIIQLDEGNADRLEKAIEEMLSDPEKPAAMAERGQAAMEMHRGAAARTVDVVLGVT